MIPVPCIVQIKGGPEAAGSGDVVGPAVSTDNAIVRFDGTGGTTIQNSTVILGDTGVLGGGGLSQVSVHVSGDEKLRLNNHVNLSSDSEVRFFDDTAIAGAALAVRWLSASGSPEGAVAANVGSLYTRQDGGAGTTLYVKESGSGDTGWVAK